MRIFAAFGGLLKNVRRARKAERGIGGRGRGGFTGWHVMCFSPGTVKVFAKTMNQEPLFNQGVWITPMILAVCGIAAALCALMLT